MADTPIVLGIQTESLAAFQRAIRAHDRDLSKSLRKKLKTVGEDKVQAAAAGTAGWSTRIPGSMRTSSTQRGVKVIAGGAKAPHAAVYETGGRHPVFGNRQVWVPVPKRPYMVPALQSNLPAVEQAAIDALDEWLGELGFR